MHGLTDLLPRVLSSVATAALSPLLARLDRLLDVAEGAVSVARDSVVLVSQIAEDVAELRRTWDHRP